MILTKLYETQTKVDQVIAENLNINIHEDERVFDRIHALKVELGEFSNELADFKYWKQSHRVDKGKALEELADCIAFLLSIGISYGYRATISELEPYKWKTLTKNDLFHSVFKTTCNTPGLWKMAFEQLIALGLKSGFSTAEMEVAYYLKSNENIERQKNNY